MSWNIKKFLTADFNFTSQEQELKSRIITLNFQLLVSVIILLVMAVVRFSNNYVTQGAIDLFFAVISVFAIFWVRGDKNRITATTRVVALAGFIMVGILFVNVPEDILRIGWFLPLLAFTFFLCGQKIGIFTSVLSMVFVWSTQLSAHTGYSNFDIFYFCVLTVLLTLVLGFYEFRNTKNRLRLQTLNNKLEDQVQARTAELALANKDLQLFFYALDTLPDSVIVSDMEGRISYANRSALKASGSNSNDLIGTSVNEFCAEENYVTNTIIPVVQARGCMESEIEANGKNGLSWPAVISSTVIQNNASMSLGILYIIRDITDIRQAEQNRLDLERKIQQSSKMEAIGLMASGVAHDLNNILSGVINYPELMLLDLPKDNPLRPKIDKIKNSGLRAAAVVADLLTVARGVATAKKTCDLNKLLQEYLVSPEVRRPLELQPGIQLHTDLSADPSTVHCSAIHIRKCLLNLIINGCEAIHESGTVTISTRTCSISTARKSTVEIPEGKYIVLSVQDSGAGISRADIVHIFEPFYSKKVMGRSGTGIGLAVVWNVVRDHEGYIEVSSDSAGTCFDLYFPISRQSTDEEETAETHNDLQGKGQTILVVDDEPAQRDIATQLLNSLGYSTTSAASGEEAVTCLNNRKADLLLLDMDLGKGINGRKTYEQIIFMHPGQKAIITSGYSETEEVKRAQDLGAKVFLKKPYTMDQLAKAVKQQFI